MSSALSFAVIRSGNHISPTERRRSELSLFRPFIGLALFAGCASLGIAATLNGVVTERGSGEGVPAAHVRLLGNGDAIETHTDEKGQFAFQHVPNGRFQVTASKDGYLDLLPPQSRGKTVRVTQSDNPPIALALTRTAAITGHVLDASGQIVRGAKVIAMAWRPGGTGRRLVAVGAPAFTDDRGAYRLYGLAPGRYTVALVPMAEKAGSAAFPPVYFPGTPEPGRAETLSLDPGDTATADIPAADLTSQVWDVQGVILGIPAAWAGRSTAVSIAPLSDPETPMATVLASPEGRFLFPGIASGAYLVTARGPIAGWGDEGPRADASGLWGASHIEAGGAPPDGVEIPLRAVGSVQGRIQFDNSAAARPYCPLRAPPTLP